MPTGYERRGEMRCMALNCLVAAVTALLSFDASAQACNMRRHFVSCIACGNAVGAYAMYQEVGKCYYCDQYCPTPDSTSWKSAPATFEDIRPGRCGQVDVFGEMQRLTATAAEFSKVRATTRDLLAIAAHNPSVATMLAAMGSKTAPAFNLRKGGMLSTRLPTHSSMQARLQSFGEAEDLWSEPLPQGNGVEVKYVAIRLSDETATVRFEAAIVNEYGEVVQNLPGVVEVNFGQRISGDSETRSATASTVRMPTYIRDLLSWQVF